MSSTSINNTLTDVNVPFFKETYICMYTHLFTDLKTKVEEQ